MSRQPDYRITIRLKPDELARLKAVAGNTPVSTCARDLILGEIVSKRKTAVRRVLPENRFLAQILAVMGQHSRIAEFKRIAKHIEDGVCGDDDEIKALISETRDWLKRIHALLMKALGVSEP